MLKFKQSKSILFLLISLVVFSQSGSINGKIIVNALNKLTLRSTIIVENSSQGSVNGAQSEF
jgi:hypothetical protein